MFKHEIESINRAKIVQLVNSKSCELDFSQTQKSVDSLVFLLEWLKNEPKSHGSQFSKDCIEQGVVTELLLNLHEDKHRCNLLRLPSLTSVRKVAIIRVIELCAFSNKDYSMPYAWVKNGWTLFEDLKNNYLNLKRTGEYYVRS